MKTLDEQIAIMTAFRDGQPVESRYYNASEWYPCGPGMLWDWANFDFRIAEGKPRKAHVVHLLGGEDGYGWRFAGSSAELAVAVPFREVLPSPPQVDLAKIVCRIKSSGYGPEIYIAGSSVPAGRKLTVGEKIDFVEVPK